MPFLKARSFGRSYLTHGAALSEARIKYPYRLVREHSDLPRPEYIDKLEEFGLFARFPSKSGDEWLFKDRHHRDLFIARFGGTTLGG